MLGGADNPNGELLSYIIGADNNRISVMLSVRSKESEAWKLPLLAGTTFY